jgi:uncharacterized protein (TIGR02145 family)
MKKLLGLGGIFLLTCLNHSCEKDNSIKDGDGNVYTYVTIGTQIWLAENLKTTRYNDGKPIPLVTDNTEWGSLTTPAYCWYNNDAATYKETYGALYNWYTVNTGKLCPKGWHVPADDEWKTFTDYLTDYVGSNNIAKTMAAAWGWNADPNAGNPGNDQASNNSSGFSALPGGCHGTAFLCVGEAGYWWHATGNDELRAYSHDLWYSNKYVFTFPALKYAGYSVRCLRN